MLDMFVFWTSYALVWIFWFSFLIYWAFPVIDKWICHITSGDLQNYLTYKFRNPFLQKFGLVEKTDKWGELRENGEWSYMFEGGEYFRPSNNRWTAILCFWLSVLGFTLQIAFSFVLLVTPNTTLGKKDFSSLHELTVAIANFLTAEMGTPILLLLILLVSNTLLKKMYSFGKKVKPLVDKLNKEDG